MNNNRRSSSGEARKTDNSAASTLSVDEMKLHPHFEVTLTARTNMDTIIDTLLEACSGLFPGERPTILLDRRHCCALISVSEHQVERLQYKSWIEHRPTGNRYTCRFREGTLGIPQKRVSVPLLGAKFAFLKSQQHVRDHLKKSEPLIRANWQQCTGAEYCYVHLHYSSEEPALLAAVEELRVFLESEAEKVLLESLPLHVPPCDRFALSIDKGFREVAYEHNVSPWTRTQRDSPLGPEWCTFATDTVEKMSATIEAYKAFARANPNFNLKVLGENSTKTAKPQSMPRTSRKTARSSASSSPSHSGASSPTGNSPNTHDLPMAPIMRHGAPFTPNAAAAMAFNNFGPSFVDAESFNKTPAAVVGGSARMTPASHHQQSPSFGFGPRFDRNAPARSIAPNDAVAPSPQMNSNLPSDLPPGLNLAASNSNLVHIPNPAMSLPSFGGYVPATASPIAPMTVAGGAPPAMGFHPLFTGLEPLRFPHTSTSMSFAPTVDPQYPSNSNSYSTTSNNTDDIWGKYSPPSESFIPSIAAANANTANNGIASSLSFSDFFINPAEANRIFSLTDSTGLSG